METVVNSWGVPWLPRKVYAFQLTAVSLELFFAFPGQPPHYAVLSFWALPLARSHFVERLPCRCTLKSSSAFLYALVTLHSSPLTVLSGAGLLTGTHLTVLTVLDCSYI